ncbi:MAG: tRNA preQ1(34) S-adenosylmethionine ribosyltransferase-isomerase QueA [Eubacteriaceae bacterium]|jgi:S-adenosylmethionine:tRNA ribosyltransferase-isomerase|nr:tRNA preQ1(34) S-adenosylmethionine ribosyltransferase-isomerase QueA [Eubacteriaceae bacterium]
MNTEDFNYALPESLIAQLPLYERDASRLLVYHRGSGRMEHRTFYDVAEYIAPKDCLVVNETKVFAARLHGKREETGGKIELLLLRETGEWEWEAMAKPASRAQPGRKFLFPGGYSAQAVAALGEGIRSFRFSGPGSIQDLIYESGEAPLPPYIHTDGKEMLERYNTVYAKTAGSVAAPTAGLHFTAGLLGKIESSGASIAKILLHVGLGTFLPVKEENAENHRMHTESYEISQGAADLANAARNRGGRIIAVGTTSVRALETAAGGDGAVRAEKGVTGIFIYPGYQFKAVDAMITNFHLPKSTLLMLVSAFMGRGEAMAMYEEAVRLRYRFYSFGDACLIL